MAGQASVVSGVVREPGGKPVSDARVYFTAGPAALPDIAVLTNIDGAYALSAPVAGRYIIDCVADGFAPESATITVASGKNMRHDFLMKR